MQPTFFATPGNWRQWLSRHHDTTSELWVGFWKRSTGKPSITWPESVDEALCFGWIDGIRRSLGEESYAIRFTPRRHGSSWSAVNLRRVAVLTAERRMRPAGLRVFEERDVRKSGLSSFEQRRNAKLTGPYARAFKANAVAWRCFTAQPPWYQRTASWWVISAKQEETRQKRLAALIADSAKGRTIPQLTRTKAVRPVASAR